MTLQPSPPAPRPTAVRLPRRRPWATYTLLGAIGLVFLGQLILAPFDSGVDPFIQYGAKINARIVQGEWWRLVTPIFVHGSLLHFFFNAYALYSLGREIEAFCGSRRFVILFFFAGVCGTTASLLLSPSASVGASGAIFGLIGAEAVLLYRNRRLLGARARAGLQNILVIAGLNLLIGLQPGLRIDNWAHLGGLLGGLIMAFWIGPLWAVETDPLFGTPLSVVDRRPLNAVRWLGVLALGLGLVGFIGLAIGLVR